MKSKRWKERLSLTLLYAAVVFVIQILSVLIGALVLIFAAQYGALGAFDISVEGTSKLLLFMAIISTLMALVITFLTRTVPMRPFNRIIDTMNRLAAGDFKARLEFGKPISDHPAFVELCDSFNTMAQELENTQMLRSDFINNFSHEFKTPIVSISGFAKLLHRGDLSPEQNQEYLAIIEEESLRLAAMATNVLELTRIENQGILANVTDFNLSEQIRACLLLLEPHWSRKELDIDIEFDEHFIQADEELLKQVWINLLDNAIKFSPQTGDIIIRIQDAGTEVQVLITNYANDIPADKLHRIWNKFYQADESHASQGNGVGLAIVKGIVDLHKGTVSVDSQNGVTTFCVTLPKRK